MPERRTRPSTPTASQPRARNTGAFMRSQNLDGWADHVLRGGTPGDWDAHQKANGRNSAPHASDQSSDAVISEDAIALTFVDRHGRDVRYDHTTKAWSVWDGARWKRDGTGLAFSWARALCREL